MADILAAVQSVDFQVSRNVAIPLRSRFMDIFLAVPNGINQVGLSFEDRPDFLIGEQHPNYLEVKLPLSYLSDIQYLLKNWYRKNLEIAYDPVSGAVTNFCLKSVNQ